MTRTATACAIACLIPAGAVLISLVPSLDAADAVVLRAPSARGHQERAREVTIKEQGHANRARQALKTAVQSRRHDIEDDVEDRTSGLAVTIFEELIYGPDGADEVPKTRGLLESHLQRQIDAIDLMCSLTEYQKKKLRLAGHGDIERFIDRIHRETRELQSVPDDAITENVIQHLARETVHLQLQLFLGCFEEESLFGKTTVRCLTEEQTGQFALLREIKRVGGLIRRRTYRTDDVVEVRLSTTAITDDDLAHLRRLTNIQFLALDATRITDAGLVELKDLNRLIILDLARTSLTGAGLVHLKPLKLLKELDLTGTQVNDDGLAHLHDLKNLERLYLTSTRVSDSGVDELKRLLPRLSIER